MTAWEKNLWTLLTDSSAILVLCVCTAVNETI